MPLAAIGRHCLLRGPSSPPARGTATRRPRRAGAHSPARKCRRHVHHRQPERATGPAPASRRCLPLPPPRPCRRRPPRPPPRRRSCPPWTSEAVAPARTGHIGESRAKTPRQEVLDWTAGQLHIREGGVAHQDPVGLRPMRCVLFLRGGRQARGEVTGGWAGGVEQRGTAMCNGASPRAHDGTYQQSESSGRAACTCLRPGGKVSAECNGLP